MPPPTKFRFTPGRMLLFLLMPALILGGMFFLATGKVATGIGMLLFFAIATAANLAIGAAVTGAGSRLADRREQNVERVPRAHARFDERSE